MSERTGRGAPGREPGPVVTAEQWASTWDGQGELTEVFTGVTFVDADMTELLTRGATFERCSFKRVRLSASRHDASVFLNCAFTGCSLFDARFTGCKVMGSEFSRCTFDVLRVDGGDWSFSSLAKADLRSSTWRRVRMREVDLTGARCDGATMRDLDLSGASLVGTSFAATDLRGCDLSSLDPRRADVTDAVVDLRQAVVLAENLGLDVRPD